jgi:hypothetical protein
MKKLFILRNDNPEELERQFSSWATNNDIIIEKIDYTCTPYKFKKKLLFSYSVMIVYTKKGLEA